jgi:hypothetical protein
MTTTQSDKAVPGGMVSVAGPSAGGTAISRGRAFGIAPALQPPRPRGRFHLSESRRALTGFGTGPTASTTSRASREVSSTTIKSKGRGRCKAARVRRTSPARPSTLTPLMASSE